MMSLYQRSDQKRARRRLVVATIAIFAIVFADVISGGVVRGAARAAHGLVWSVASNIESLTWGSGFFSSKSALQAENTSLKQRLASLEVGLAGVERVKYENAQLRALVHLAEREPGIAAPIISSLRSSPYGAFMIGAGSAESIAAHSIVIAGGAHDIVVGEVVEVYGKSALVKEVFAPGVSVEGIVEGAEITLEGRGGGNARAQVPRTLGLAEGDMVTSREFGGRVIGVVGAISSETASAFAIVYVRTPVNRSELTFVYVVPRPN
jgi:cell shape-determining protein MreC